MVNIYAQMLLRRPGLADDGEAAEFSGFIRSGVERMENLIKDLLLYSRVVHTEADEAAHADLNRVVGEALEVLRMRIDETGASITHELLPEVYGDESQLVLVFQNVLSNSLKYRNGDVAPAVHVSAEVGGPECLVRIRDNGIGFEPHHSERIFGLFKRLHKDEYPGTGLGLAICRRVVERYGGRMWAESDGEGRGATFTIAFRRPRV
jgi:light-regulated signal transduction histidine kinase (bacteriophytochrome)